MSNDADGRSALDALANLYRRKADGVMRQCRHAVDDSCLTRNCFQNGCWRANDILKTAQLPATGRGEASV